MVVLVSCPSDLVTHPQPVIMVHPGLKNSSENGWIVQKFGGTSVGKFPDKIAEDIVRYDE